jgi:hypothetical protein
MKLTIRRSAAENTISTQIGGMPFVEVRCWACCGSRSTGSIHVVQMAWACCAVNTAFARSLTYMAGQTLVTPVATGAATLLSLLAGQVITSKAA